MSNTYRYQLEKGSKKHYCPSCNKRKYVRYIDMQSNGYIPLKYGCCDRSSKCSYHCNPYKDKFNKGRHQEIGNQPKQNLRNRLPISLNPYLINL